MAGTGLSRMAYTLGLTALNTPPTRIGRQSIGSLISAEHWSKVGKGLDSAMDAYNKATGTLESRVLVTARRFRDLEAADADVEIDTAEPLDHSPRALQAPEMLPRTNGEDD